MKESRKAHIDFDNELENKLNSLSKKKSYKQFSQKKPFFLEKGYDDDGDKYQRAKIREKNQYEINGVRLKLSHL